MHDDVNMFNLWNTPIANQFVSFLHNTFKKEDVDSTLICHRSVPKIEHIYITMHERVNRTIRDEVDEKCFPVSRYHK